MARLPAATVASGREKGSRGGGSVGITRNLDFQSIAAHRQISFIGEESKAIRWIGWTLKREVEDWSATNALGGGVMVISLCRF